MTETKGMRRISTFKNNKNQLELLTVEEMGKLLRISRSKAYSLIQEKDFPIIKIGRCVRIEKNLLLSWLHNHNVI